MENYSIDGFGKVHIIRLARGELVIESVREFLEKAGIKNAVAVSCVGSFQKLKFRRPTDLGEHCKFEYLCIEAPMEVGTLTGSVINGSVHFHVVAADTEKQYCGHMDEGTETLYFLEIILVELVNCNLERCFASE